ncbi:MAG: hypothetical protein K8T20_19030 [Planctomycetes bacterium]|nr:hypothetical protein [Planctomycetota bacterium]
MGTLAKMLTVETLRGLARNSRFRHGEDLLAASAVVEQCELGAILTAVVREAQPYEVRIVAGPRELEWSCSCSRATDGVFCAHIVAPGLAWLRRGSTESREPEPSAVEVEAFLASQKKSDLVRRIVTLADQDPVALRTLRLEVAAGRANTPAGLDTRVLRKALDSALRHPERRAWNEDEVYARGIETVVDQVERLIETGHAKESVGLIEAALRGVENAMAHLSGEGIGVQLLRERLEAMHVRACTAAPPEPEDLARSLFAWALSGAWDTFSDAPVLYRDVLGDRGLAVYRSLAEAEWVKVPALKAGDQFKAHAGNRLRISTMMESLARASGTVDDVVAVKSKDLSSPWSYLQVAEVLRDSGRFPEALTWAERGVGEFPDPRDYRLRDFLAEEYVRQGRGEDAVRLAWEEFLRHPGSSAWERLKKRSEVARSWESWRIQALDHARIPRQGEDSSNLVDILCFEGDFESAWREATARGCNDQLWSSLATARQDGHPDDSLVVWHRLLEKSLRSRTSTTASTPWPSCGISGSASDFSAGSKTSTASSKAFGQRTRRGRSSCSCRTVRAGSERGVTRVR